jgi:hypothetical protein
MMSKLLLVALSALFFSAPTIAAGGNTGDSLPAHEDGCMVSRNEATGAIAARAVNPKTGELLESVEIAGDGTVTRAASKDGKGSLFKNCDATILNVLGRADEKRIMRAARS